jgi:hypothetical protein
MAQDRRVYAGVYFCGVDGVLCPDLFYWPLDLESADMKTIIEMAREADPKANLNEPYCLDHETRAWLERFAALVAAAEREACAKLVDHILKEGGGTWGDAIRARGQA